MAESPGKRLAKAAKEDGGVENTAAKARKGVAAQRKPSLTRYVDGKGNTINPPKNS